MADNKNPLVELNQQFVSKEAEFAKALPAHIPPQRFVRVVMTAIQRDLELLTASRKSLFKACLECAQDGLLPDGREAVLVAYKGEVTYQSMIAGIRKKVRQSGEIATWEARIAHENDDFEIVLGDEERIHHIPLLRGARGDMIAVYSIARFKDGFVSRDWMTMEEVEAIRKLAKTQKIWSRQEFYPEMVKKTMLRRHSKALPLSAELDRLMEREDESVDLGALHAPASIMLPRESATEAIEDQRVGESGNGEQPPKKRRGRPTLSDVKDREAQKAEAQKASATDVTEEEEEDNGGEHMDADWYSVGYDAYLEKKPVRPYPPDCRGVENKEKAREYEKGWLAAQQEAMSEDDADTAGAE